jgi:hypothetical protein
MSDLREVRHPEVRVQLVGEDGNACSRFSPRFGWIQKRDAEVAEWMGGQNSQPDRPLGEGLARGRRAPRPRCRYEGGTRLRRPMNLTRNWMP